MYVEASHLPTKDASLLQLSVKALSTGSALSGIYIVPRIDGPFIHITQRIPSLTSIGSDVNSTLCCTNEQYCIVNSTWGVQCCALGSTCRSRCDTSHYFANTTMAVTTTLAVVTVENAAAETLTSSKTTTTFTTSSVCSPRSCTSTHYLCASSFGGGCCPYGFDCASSGQCIGTSSTLSASSSTSSVSPLVTPLPSGCSAQGQTLCTAGAEISGSGCCDAGYACITVSLSLMCSPTPTSSVSSATATAPGNVTVDHASGNSSLSTGAKAGIAIGVIVAAAVGIGGLTWLCIKRRRDGRSTTTGNEMRSLPPNDNNTPRAGAAGAYSDGPGRPHFGSSGRNMSEPSGYAPSSTQVSRDYFGSGPYSDHHGSIAPYNNDDDNYGAKNNRTWESVAATAGTPLANEQGYYYQGYHHLLRDDQQIQQQQQQVPHGPAAVLTPVEIGHGGSVKRGPAKMIPTGAGSSDISSSNNNDDDSRRRGYSHAGSDGAHSELADTSSAPRRGGRNPSYGGQGGGGGVGSGGTGVRHSIAGRFELHGSEAGGGTGTVGTYLPQPFPTPGSEMSEFGTPSPLSREGEQQHPRRDV